MSDVLKRLLCLVLALVVVFSFSACRKSPVLEQTIYTQDAEPDPNNQQTDNDEEHTDENTTLPPRTQQQSASRQNEQTRVSAIRTIRIKRREIHPAYRTIPIPTSRRSMTVLRSIRMRFRKTSKMSRRSALQLCLWRCSAVRTGFWPLLRTSKETVWPVACSAIWEPSWVSGSTMEKLP